MGVPKTVDNDLCGTDHTPGFGSAARYVALSVKQAGMLARDMRRVDQYVIFQTVGRSAGWLPAASALAKTAEDDAPHIILLPERPFDRERFLADVKRCYDRYGWCSVVCGEGVCYADGTPISAAQATDKFANVEFGAMGGASAAMMLHRMIHAAYGWRGEFQVCESLQMCAADRVWPGDVEEAYACGRRAVELAAAGTSGVMVSIVRESSNPYRWSLGTAPLAEVALGAKPMPDEFITADGNFVTPRLHRLSQAAGRPAAGVRAAGNERSVPRNRQCLWQPPYHRWVRLQRDKQGGGERRRGAVRSRRGVLACCNGNAANNGSRIVSRTAKLRNARSRTLRRNAELGIIQGVQAVRSHAEPGSEASWGHPGSAFRGEA